MKQMAMCIFTEILPLGPLDTFPSLPMLIHTGKDVPMVEKLETLL